MEVLDIVYDNDAKIGGLIVNKIGNDFKVLWKNGVYGTVREEFDEIEVKKHSTYKKFYLIDVLHTGYSGKKFQRKTDKKYDDARDKIALIDMSKLCEGYEVLIHLYDEDELNCKKEVKTLKDFGLRTTYFEKIYKDKQDLTYIVTRNSIYLLEEL